jgi:RimJ/RimL family protein N-acetyltransferase
MGVQVTVREATVEDRIALWDWRNDSVPRGIFKVDPVVTYKHHRAWFERLMASEKTALFVGTVETLRIACVRFDVQGDGVYGVHIHIKPMYCGKNLGEEMLKEAVDHLKTARPVSKIYATIRNVNPASGNLFRNAGFRIEEREQDVYCEWCSTE